MNINQGEEEKREPKRLGIALVSDFYLPNKGGVQIHIQQLANLLSKKYKVIVITHQRQNHIGKIDKKQFVVYYLPLAYHQSLSMTYPTFFLSFQKIKQILTNENIQIVHCHQSCSPLSLETIFYAKKLKLKTLLTEHSLVGFGSLLDIHFNALFSVLLPSCDKIVAVSRTTRNNIILRADLDPKLVTVIPNGVRKPQRKNLQKKVEQKTTIKILTIGRLVIRRGTDLLIDILPEICSKHKDINIFIVGEGVKLEVLKKSIQEHSLEDKVFLYHSLEYEQVCQLMEQCDIFLNTAITQSFGIALVEAASLGLHCVSTNVGGIPETLPPEVLTVVNPVVPQIVQALSHKITSLRGKNQQKEFKDYGYDWNDCEERISEIYQQIMEKEPESDKSVLKSLWKRSLLGIYFIFAYLLLFIIDCFTKSRKTKQQ